MYTGIFQFPKRLSEDWNLINRIVLTVPSVPLDQDKINDFDPTSGQKMEATQRQYRTRSGHLARAIRTMKTNRWWTLRMRRLT